MMYLFRIDKIIFCVIFFEPSMIYYLLRIKEPDGFDLEAAEEMSHVYGVAQAPGAVQAPL